MQEDTCTKNRIDFKHIIAVGFNISEEEANVKYMKKRPIYFENDQCKAIEDDLRNYRPADNVEHAMKILRGPDLENSRDRQSAVVGGRKFLCCF